MVLLTLSCTRDGWHTSYRAQADGLAFSVLPGVKKIPPSLRNLLKEVATDVGTPPAATGSLVSWAQQVCGTSSVRWRGMVPVAYRRAGDHRACFC